MLFINHGYKPQKVFLFLLMISQFWPIWREIIINTSDQHEECRNQGHNNNKPAVSPF